jgi:FdhE protein
MPHVVLGPAGRESRLADARERWHVLRAHRPDLEPAIALQEQLLTIVIDLAEQLDSRPLLRLSLPPKYVAAKLTRGKPALAGEPLPIPVATLKPSLLALCRALSRGGTVEAADHIGEALESGRMDAGSLLTASLTRDQDAIRTGAVHRGLAPDLLWLVAELGVGPYAYALQRAIFNSPDGSLLAALEQWTQGYCPACGSWPALAEIVSSHRLLRCSFCAAAWEMSSYACVYCGEEGEAFVTAAPDQERIDRRLEVCGSCAGYLKTVDLTTLSPFPLVAIADLETMDLDAAAMEHNYSRPPAKDFGKR